MKELKNMPVKVVNGEKDIEVFEFESGFCMTTEFIGKAVGYKDTKSQMSKLLKRHREALEPHRFVVFKGDKLTGNKLALKPTYSDRGRPSFFYDEDGIVKIFMLANTPKAREFGPKVIDYLKYLNAKRIERIEKSWFARRPWWPEVRERVMKGETFKEIAGAMGRSAASVRNAVRRMIEFGIMMPLRAAQALTGRAKRTVLDYGRKYYGDTRQQLLFGGDAALPA